MHGPMLPWTVLSLLTWMHTKNIHSAYIRCVETKFLKMSYCFYYANLCSMISFESIYSVDLIDPMVLVHKSTNLIEIWIYYGALLMQIYFGVCATIYTLSNDSTLSTYMQICFWVLAAIYDPLIMNFTRSQ